MTFSIIVAADRNNGIGKDGKMPWPKLKHDLEHFKKLTMGHAVIMGRKTWDSLPESVRPLPGRENIVLSRGPWRADVPNVKSLEQALLVAHVVSPSRGKFAIGGGEIYRLALAHPDCGDVYLTRIDAECDCNVTFPDITQTHQLRRVIGEWSEPVPYRIELWSQPW